MRPWYKRHHDDEFCDEINIKIVPRFKSSDLSGDEWRVSAVVQLFRKGMMYAEKSYNNMNSALLCLGSFFTDDAHGNGYPIEAIDHERAKCDQPGCSEDAVNHYKKKREHVGDGFMVRKEHEVRCKFCIKHSERGDSDLEDCDSNLEKVL
jgi:hypothetical protein